MEIQEKLMLLGSLRICLPALLVVPALGAAADLDRGIHLGPAKVSQWRFGVVVKATGSVSGIRATLPLPMDWPEQTVKKIAAQKSPRSVSISEKTLDGGVKQMIVSIPRLAAGEEAAAVVTLEVTRSRIDAPAETNVYRAPKPSPSLTKYLSPSPFIESKDPKIKAIATELTANQAHDWDKAAAIFDWVRANVKYEFAEDIKPATAALKNGNGDCEELSSLVIAMCRASGIPARAVWIPSHTYPEFYLVDEHGKGHWFPCQAAGDAREFGGIIEDRPVLQKGDNFTVPGEKTPQRYVKQSLTAKDAAAPPEVKFIMERVRE